MKLFAGPFCGEFGWELMTWQGHLRAIAPDYDEVIVCCPPNHEMMYMDFASWYVNYDPSTVKANMWMNESQDAAALKGFISTIGGEYVPSEDKLLTPSNVWQPYVGLNKWEQLIAIKPQKYIKFGKPEDVGYNVIIHARNRVDWDSGFRNWKRKHCRAVVEALPNATIACIGTTEHALHIEGTIDLRDLPLDVLFNYMASSKVFVGPISGPTHLATLCGLPQVTWATKQEHKERIEKKWNPFDTPTSVICADDWVWKQRVPWHPEVSEITEKIGEYL